MSTKAYKRCRRKKARRKRRLQLAGKLAVALIIIVVLFRFTLSYLDNQSSKSGSTTEASEAGVEENVLENILANTNDNATITEYYTYGTHFNLEGTVTGVNSSDIDSMRLIFCQDSDSMALSSGIDLTWTVENGVVSFVTSEEINSGVDLEAIAQGTYYMLLEITGTEKTYSTFSNASDQDEIEYYTVTDTVTNSNNRIEICGYSSSDNSDCLVMDVDSCVLPSDVYDIVIDAGHGGTDGGAVYGSYTEADLVLQCALQLYENLTDAGYKVLLTRDGTEDSNTAMAYTMYDEDGRVNVACGSKAKYAVSLHLNSNEQATDGGVQVYYSNRGNSDFASLLADNIVKTAGTTYSTMETGYVTSGVYTSTFTAATIKEAQSEAAEGGYAAYALTTDTDYYYMIRELGGIATNAYVDGRNTDIGTNLYVSSHQGVESCLCELGFLSNSVDRKNIVNNIDAYAEALADAIISQCSK